jgi:CysZ protein
MIGDAAAAFFEIFTPPFRAVLWKVLGLTLLLLVLAVGALHHILLGLVIVSTAWLATLFSVLAGLGLAVASIFLVAPVSVVVAGFFIDELAATVERDVDPLAPVGRPLSLLDAAGLSARYAILSIVVMLVALLLLLVPGVNVVAFLGANAYLFGRQYFEFAALRHMALEDAQGLRHRHAGRVYLAGLLIAGFVSVPLLNLLTPLFGTALMVRVFKRIVRVGVAPPGPKRGAR